MKQVHIRRRTWETTDHNSTMRSATPRASVISAAAVDRVYSKWTCSTSNRVAWADESVDETTRGMAFTDSVGDRWANVCSLARFLLTNRGVAIRRTPFFLKRSHNPCCAQKKQNSEINKAEIP